MRDLFQGFYGPTAEEFKSLWETGLVVVDTNVLLTLYSLPTTRDEYLAIFESLKERLWIPHQVALEFQKNRLKKITEHRKSTAEALSKADQQLTSFCEIISSLQMDKRGLDIDTEPLINDLKKSHEAIVDAIKKTHASLPGISFEDSVRDQLDRIFSGRIGKGPANQQELNELVRDADARYQKRIPPGFSDVDKDKNPHNAAFVFDHVEYQRKHGDLILWRQIINHAKETGQKAVLFVTLDSKDDWWWREQNQTLGPHTELITEMKREAGVEIFWMYSAPNFLQHASTYFNAKVSTKMVEEVERVSSEYHNEIQTLYSDILRGSLKKPAARSGGYQSYLKMFRENRVPLLVVMDWCSARGDIVAAPQNAHVDFFIDRNRNLTAVNMRSVSDPLSENATQLVLTAIGHMEVEASRWGCNSILTILIVPKEFADNQDLKAEVHRCFSSIDLFIMNGMELEVIVGTIEDGHFTKVCSSLEPF